MNKSDMLYYFLASSKNSRKRIKVTGGEKVVVKGFVQEVSKDDKSITVVVEDTSYVIDLEKSHIRTGIFDSRTLIVDGELPLKFQLC